MARKSGSTISQEELYPPAHEPARPAPDGALDDARMLDLDVEQESPFLRGQKRVSVRRGSLPKNLWDNYGMHQERGKETITHIVRMFAGHDLNHLMQVEKISKGNSKRAT